MKKITKNRRITWIKDKKNMFAVTALVFFALLSCVIVMLISVTVRDHKTHRIQMYELKETMIKLEEAADKRMAGLEMSIQEKLTSQTELPRTELMYEVRSAIAAPPAPVSSSAPAVIFETGSQITAADERVQRVDEKYTGGVLARVERNTLDSLYSGSLLAEMEKEAEAFFQKGNYARAAAKYLTVASAQPDNAEIRFYYLYSLFLSNKLDRDNYARIKDGLYVLERGGFYHPRLREALDFIELEERGLVAEAPR